jgi:hypothetical protein
VEHGDRATCADTIREATAFRKSDHSLDLPSLRVRVPQAHARSMKHACGKCRRRTVQHEHLWLRTDPKPRLFVCHTCDEKWYLWALGSFVIAYLVSDYLERHPLTSENTIPMQPFPGGILFGDEVHPVH